MEMQRIVFPRPTCENGVRSHGDWMEMDRTDASLIALRKILRATELFGKELAQAAGLSPVQFRVLQLVDEQGQSTPKSIATQMGVTQATVTALLDKLERQGLISRTRSDVDRRKMNIAMTSLGHDTLDDAPAPLQQRYVRRFEALADWEQAQIIASLERVAGMLDAGALDASPVLDLGDIRQIQS